MGGAQATPGTGRVLGIDPGTVVTGWGVIDEAGQKLLRVASGIVRPAGDRAERLAAIFRALGDLCERFRPGVISLEQSFVGDNVQTAFRLGEARGAVMVAAASHGLPVVEYTPAQIKLAVAGSGRAVKTQMQLMVAKLLAIEILLAADEADALGVAICHLHSSRFDARVLASAALPGPLRARGRWRRR